MTFKATIFHEATGKRVMSFYCGGAKLAKRTARSWLRINGYDRTEFEIVVAEIFVSD